MLHQAIKISTNNYKSAVIYKDDKHFEFDETFCGGEFDRAFYLTCFDINLVTWEGDERDNDSYYDGVEDDYDKGMFQITKIGEIRGNYYNIERMQLSRYNIFDVFDMQSTDEERLAEALIDIPSNGLSDEVNNKIAFWAPKAFFYIDHFEIYKPYQNKGYGTEILKNIDKMLYFGMDYSISFVALHCNPMDDDKHDNDEAMVKLAKFYEKCGFEHIGEEICMIKILDDFVNEDY